MLLAGCGEQKRASEQAPAAGTAAQSDTTAFAAWRGLSDDDAKITGARDFLGRYPNSSFRGAISGSLFGLLAKTDAAGARDFAEKSLTTEKDPATRARLWNALYDHTREHDPAQIDALLARIEQDPGAGEEVFNSIAWDLVERNERLDHAVQLATVGLARAKDSNAKASVLDTRGWAHYARKDYPAAVTDLEAARAALPEPMQEIDEHLAMAYDAAGMKPQARDLYAALLVGMENPDMRERVRVLSRELDGSEQAAMRSIEEKRLANSKPAPDFALKDYDGKEIKLSDFRGKIVQLNFWHPT